MWFVGCTDRDGSQFSIPWYWTKAHPAEKNLDRSKYHEVLIATPGDLEAFRNRAGPIGKVAIELMPTQELIRDMKFVGAVGAAARALGVPVILAGSPLAHAYFTLTRVQTQLGPSQ
jgi:uncharacterized protein (DUF2126 family)